MKDLKDIQFVYFIGIGGIGMSALARFMKMAGKTVSGYDKTKSDITTTLINEGIDVIFSEEISALPSWTSDNDQTLIVYTPAIPKTNEILRRFEAKNYTVVKRAER